MPSTPPFTVMPAVTSAFCTARTDAPFEPRTGRVSTVSGNTTAGRVVVGATVVVTGARVVVVASAETFNTFAVGASTTPEARSPTTFWKFLSARNVFLSNTPVTPPLSVKPLRTIAACTADTCAPLSPNFGCPGAVFAVGAAETVAACAVCGNATRPIDRIAPEMMTLPIVSVRLRDMCLLPC